MLVRRFSIAFAVAAMIAAAAALAQKPAAPAPAKAAAAQASAAVQDGGVPKFLRPETAEQRKERLGTPEDPGPDPDPSKHYWRFGHSFHISKFERRFTVYDNTTDANYVRPMGFVNFAYELYQQNDKWVWCWMPDMDEAAVKQQAAITAAPTSPFDKGQIAWFARVRPQFAALTPSESNKTITFAESSDGLPKTGSWRNSLTVADMNEDGCPDIIAPPERKGPGVPVIFLGDCKGHWRQWNEVSWPHGLDYGSVATADFNKDGHADLVFGVHLNGIYVFLGDGKGHFTESAEGLPRDFPTRRVVAADVDRDGYPDIVASTEGPDALSTTGTNLGRIRVYMNRKKGTAWEGVSVLDPSVHVGGDWLSVGNLNDDRYPDIIASSVFYNATQVAHLSTGPEKWELAPTDGDVIPALCYFFASTIGKFERASAKDEAIISYVRFWPSELDARLVAAPALTEMTSVDRLVFTKDGPKRTALMSWSGHVGVHGLASGDFDHDGNLDVIFTREDAGEREVIILLGDGKGNFRRAHIEGLTLDANNLYDIKIADVNGDGRPDVILMYETLESRRDDFLRIAVQNQPGSIKVFLNRGVVSAPQPMKAAAK
jgi:hypothetical protein